MDAQARLTHLLQVLLESIRERRLNMPDCKVGALGEDCLCQNSVHWWIIVRFSIQTLLQMDETGLKLLSSFDVKKHATQQTATPNCPFLLKGSAV